jgi:methionyl-tRNA formyltransferase
VGWRVAIISQNPRALAPVVEQIRAAGHEPAGLLFVSGPQGRPAAPEFDEFAQRLIVEAPPELDIVVPAIRPRMAPLLAVLEPDLALCIFFPWKVPPEALAVPRLGIVNCHYGRLPFDRGPLGSAWAVRRGERELAITWHRMDENLDTGPILAQATFPIGDDDDRSAIRDRSFPVMAGMLPRVFERIANGDSGDPQEEGSYNPLFEEEFAWIDTSRPAREVHSQVRAWWFGLGVGTRGPIMELDGERVRVLRTSLAECEGRRVECGDGPLWILETEPFEEAR